MQSPIFRFMDLPKELRLMVYDAIQPRTKHYAFELTACETDTAYPPDSALQLVWKILPSLSILRTCRAIHAECAPILHAQLREMQQSPVRIIASPEALATRRLAHEIIPFIAFRFGGGECGRQDVRDVLKVWGEVLEPKALGYYEVLLPKRHVEIALLCGGEATEELERRLQFVAQDISSLQYTVCFTVDGSSPDGYPIRVHVRLAPMGREGVVIEGKDRCNFLLGDWEGRRKARCKTTVHLCRDIGVEEWREKWCED